MISAVALGVNRGCPRGLHGKGFAFAALTLQALVAIPTHQRASRTSRSDGRQRARQVTTDTCRFSHHTEKKASCSSLKPPAEDVCSNIEPSEPLELPMPPPLQSTFTYLQSPSRQASDFTFTGFKCWRFLEGARSALCHTGQRSISSLWSIMVISAAKPHITHASTSNTSAPAAQIPTFSVK